MSTTTEVGVAYVRLLPSMEGFAADVKRELADVLTKTARQAGEDAGKAMARGIEDGADDADTDGIVSGIGDKLKLGMAAVGIGAGALLVEGITSAMDLEATTDKLAAQIGTGFAEDAGKIAGDLYTAGFGDSVSDTADAVRRIYQNGLLPDEFTNDEFENLATQVLTFSDVLEQDMDMTTQSIKSMLESGIAGTAEEALDVMTRSIQLGADKAGDLAETFQEYSTNFSSAGLSAADAAGLMVQGLSAGARDADKVADAIKEFGIRAQDGSKLSADGFKAIGLSAEDMTAKVAQGGPAARDALDQVLDGLRNMEDPVARNAAAVALFGTQAEDLGGALFALDLDTVATDMGNSAGSTEQLGSAYDNAAAKIESFKRGALMELTEFIGGTVIPATEELWAKFGPDLESALATGRNAIMSVKDGLSEVKDKLSEFWTAMTTGEVGEGTSTVEKLGLAVRDVLTKAQPVLDVFKEAWKQLIEFITTNPEVAQGILVGLGLAFAAVALAVAAVSLAVAGGVLAFGLLVAGVSFAVGWLVNHAKPAFDVASDAASALGRAVGWLAGEVGKRIGEVVGFFTALPGQIRSAFGTVAQAISAPFTSAFNAIRSAWNKTVGGFSFKVPDWIPGVGGKGFSIPKMHTGGIFDAPGGEGLALLQRGEGVFTPQQMAALGSGATASARPVLVELHADGVDRALLEWLRRSIRVEGGGNVQLALGVG